MGMSARRSIPTRRTTPRGRTEKARRLWAALTQLEQDVKEARWVLERLPELGISMDKMTRQLEDEGVEKFNKPFDKLMETLAQRSARHLTGES
jgi:transaldolase